MDEPEPCKQYAGSGQIGDTSDRVPACDNAGGKGSNPATELVAHHIQAAHAQTGHSGANDGADDG